MVRRDALILDTATLRHDLHLLNYKLRELGQKTTRKNQRAAITSATRYLTEQVKNSPDLPGMTGLLKKSIQHKVWAPRNNRLVIMGIVGQQTNKANKSGRRYTGANAAKRGGGLSGGGRVAPIHFTISRIKPHQITPKGKALRWETGRTGRGRSARVLYQYSIRTRHGGIAPNEWFAYTADSNHETTTQVYYTRLKALTDREVARLAAKG